MVTLTGHTALSIWASDGLPDALPLMGRGTDWGGATSRDVRAAALELGLPESEEVEVLLRKGEGQIRAEGVRPCLWTGELPAGTLFSLVPGVLVTSPEMCCLQIARREGIWGAVEAEMECLGSYGRVPTTRGFLDRRPIATRESLREFFGMCGGHHGVRVARSALSWALPGSRSPMETTVAMTLTLPVRYGGHGLEPPEMNYQIVPGDRDQEFSQGRRYVVDMCWPERRTVIEYDSYLYHSSMTAHDHDAMKRNSLTIMGWKVFTVTFGQLSGPELDVLVRQIARAIGRTASF